MRVKRAIYLLAFTLLLLLPALRGFSQKGRIDSLKTAVKNSAPDTNRVKLLNSLAFALRLSDLPATERYRNEALKLSVKLKYADGIAWAQYLEGVIYTYQNKLMKSVNSLTIALALANKVKDYELVARAHNGIGLNNLRLEDDYNAMKSFEKALVAIRKAKERSFESALLHNIGSLHVKNKRFNEAIKALEQSIAINITRNNKTGLALNFKEMGLAFYDVEDYRQALTYAEKSLALSRETDFSLNEINSLSLLGATYLKLGHLAKAKYYFDEAYQKAIPNNPQREKLLIYNGYADYYSAAGNYKEALKYQNQYAALYDSLYSVGRSKLILEYQEKFQAQQKETENKLLRIEQSDTENQIRQRNQILILILSILAVFIIFSVLIFWGNTRVKQANRLLLEQKNEIEIQKDNVDQLNTIKDKLFSVIAHDLRTPFASLKNMMDMYDEGMISKEDVSYFFKEIRRDIGSNTLLLDNLLIWAKSQLHGFNVEPKTLAMGSLVNEIIYYYGKVLETRHIEVINQLDDSCIVESDYEMTKTIVRNLVGNAIKFTPVNGTITVSYIKTGGEIQISVTDTGVGMSRDAIEKLFQDAFFTTQGLNHEKGTGLGLQICREFVEKNNGRIWVDSEEGKGSSFRFTLPESSRGVEHAISNADIEEEKKESLNELINIARLKNKYDKFELLLKTSNDTIWDWDLATNEVAWNEALQSNFGYSEERTSIEWWWEKINPESLGSVKEVVRSAIRNKQRIFEVEYTLRCADSSYKYVLDRGLIVYDGDENATRVLGVTHNMDNDKNAIREIKRLSLVATNVNNLVVIADAGARIIWVNHAFEKQTGYTLGEVIGEDLNRFLSGPDTDADALALAEKRMANKDGFVIEVINYTKTGQPYWVQINCAPYDDPSSGQTGYISIHTNVTERKTNEKQMIEQNDALREIARITSHEVRSPLSSILGLIKIIQSNLSMAERKECINLLEESAAQLDMLIHRVNDHITEIDKADYENA